MSVRVVSHRGLSGDEPGGSKTSLPQKSNQVTQLDVGLFSPSLLLPVIVL